MSHTFLMYTYSIPPFNMSCTWQLTETIWAMARRSVHRGG